MEMAQINTKLVFISDSARSMCHRNNIPPPNLLIIIITCYHMVPIVELEAKKLSNLDNNIIIISGR